MKLINGRFIFFVKENENSLFLPQLITSEHERRQENHTRRGEALHHRHQGVMGVGQLLYLNYLLKTSVSPVFNQLEKVDAIGLTGQIDDVVFFC